MLVAARLSVAYPRAARPAVVDLSFEVVPGRLTAIVGPNGSGKTSVLRALLGLVPPAAGSVTLEGRPIGGWSAPERARRIGLVAQREEYPFAWRVAELVSFGRYPWLSPGAPLGGDDRMAIAAALERADVTALADRRIDTLSGGEWQRVRIARALAQQPRILLLDEPTANLDLGHEMGLFELVRTLTDGGLASLVVTHHLNLAARFADRILLLADGRLAADGSPETVLDPERLDAVFHWPVAVTRSRDGAPQVEPLRARDRPSLG